MPKKEVLYYPRSGETIVVGSRAFVLPDHHPNVLNGNHVYTSIVLSYDNKTGCFETENSRYIPKASLP